MQVFVRQGIAIALWALFPAMLVTAAETISFEAEVLVDLKWFKPGGGEGHATNWFRVVVSDAKTRIRAGGMSNEKVQFFEHTCDGTNSAMLMQYVSDSDDDIHWKRRVLNDAMLILNTGVVPEYNYGFITQVWLAYASRWFYSHSASHRTEPVFFMGRGFRSEGSTVESHWQLAKEPPGVLAWMCDYFDGGQYHREDLQLVRNPLPPPFDTLVTNSLYFVRSWTNFNELSLPLEWEIRRYRPNVSEGKLEVDYVTKGYTTAIRKGTSITNFTPTVPRRTYIIDRSLPAQGVSAAQYVYMTFEGRILTLPELQRRPDFLSILSHDKF